jgi:carbon storage regulator
MIGETIRIGDDIEITITKQSNYSTQIGIEAPKDVPVYREELYQAMQQGKAGNQG